MNVAVQLFGHLRTFARCAPALREHLLDRYPQHDVFIHTWDRLDHETVTHHSFRGAPVELDAATRQAVCKAYRPVQMEVGRQIARDLGELTFANGKRMAISGIAYMFESMAAANRLREAHSATTGVEYDVVVAVRPDVMLHRPLEIERFLSYCSPPNLPTDETLHTRFTAAGSAAILNDLRGLSATDLLFFARPSVMSRIMALGAELHRYDVPSVVSPSRPRNLLNTFCADVGIDVAVIDYNRPRDFDIARPS